MGRRKKTESAVVLELPVGKMRLSAYTQARLGKMAEAQLEQKEIEIKSGHLKDNMFCHYGYEHTVAANTTDSVTRKSQVPVHDDMKERFKDLHVHLAIVCEEIHPDEIPDIDNLPELKPDMPLDDPRQDPLAVKLSRFSVGAFRIVGTGENEGVILTGQKQLSTLDYVKLETPITRYQGEYAFVNELHVAIFNLVEEIEAYMDGKQAPPRQQELDFAGDDEKGNGDDDDE